MIASFPTWDGDASTYDSDKVLQTRIHGIMGKVDSLIKATEDTFTTRRTFWNNTLSELDAFSKKYNKRWYKVLGVSDYIRHHLVIKQTLVDYFDEKQRTRRDQLIESLTSQKAKINAYRDEIDIILWLSRLSDSSDSDVILNTRLRKRVSLLLLLDKHLDNWIAYQAVETTIVNHFVRDEMKRRVRLLSTKQPRLRLNHTFEMNYVASIKLTSILV